jgi:glucose-1-phosphate thymidylyltransferase
MVEHKENYRLGVPYFDETGRLIKVVEKPKNPPNPYGVPGLYFFNQHVFEAFTGQDAIKPSARGELEITDLYSYLISKGYRVDAEEVEGRWMDPGKFDDMLEANAYLLGLRKDTMVDGEIDTESTLTGVVRIGAGARIINSVVIGPVDIAENTVVQDSRIGPSVSIADHCKIEATVIENSVIMGESTILSVTKGISNSLIGKSTEIWEESEEQVSLFIGDHYRVKLT